ncbi:MAG: DeoR family transcriptional regulator, partial [Candidatus Staskawiczbacteria bacterium]|nr:DeoR family transcriptional regulator [Candidatus Staskawiczbacteria bacterium]
MEDKFIKLTSAVYRLLDFFPEGEPLKNRAKDKVLAITENLVLIFGTQGWASLQKDKASGQLSEDIEVLLTYLKLAKSFGWIDSVNFLIISKEYENIKKQINFGKNQDRFYPPVKPIEQAIAKEVEFQTEPIQAPDMSAQTENTNIVAKTQKVTFQKTVENQVLFTEKMVSPPKTTEFLISDRQKKILQILSEKGKAQVSDFKTVLTDVTKRTIRRDLDEL